MSGDSYSFFIAPHQNPQEPSDDELEERGDSDSENYSSAYSGYGDWGDDDDDDYEGSTFKERLIERIRRGSKKADESESEGESELDEDQENEDEEEEGKIEGDSVAGAGDSVAGAGDQTDGDDDASIQQQQRLVSSKSKGKRKGSKSAKQVKRTYVWGEKVSQYPYKSARGKDGLLCFFNSVSFNNKVVRPGCVVELAEGKLFGVASVGYKVLSGRKTNTAVGAEMDSEDGMKNPKHVKLNEIASVSERRLNAKEWAHLER